MKAYVMDAQGNHSLQERPKPNLINEDDIIVKIESTSICGTDLQILRGTVPTFKSDTVLGHEGVGIVEECGSHIKKFKPGDRVVISCTTSCGSCSMCQKSQFGQCINGGWMLGNEIDGCHAEYVRVPYGDNSLFHAPENIANESLVLLSDIFPTGYEVGVLDGKLKPADTLAIIGCGPVGLAALMTAQFFSPSKIYAIDNNPHRLNAAKKLGATHTINNSENTAVDQILDITDGVGVDVVIEAIGIPAGWDMSQQLVCPGGNIAVLGVHGKSATINLEDMWKRNFTMTAGLVHTYSVPTLIKQIQAGHLHPEKLCTHHFPMGEFDKAYDTFINAEENDALKVLVSR
ncbi:alcohol dehydrogenase catalytic domain-containing protein [Vibrio sp. OCN044]|uniref:Alcohol dehydrogenase catalytic domain-containing protein n=1 Tax=Vibrio tetraodonis subsp. pristinus TaxID=2695891 RepID=A0A6L8LQ08_9VIBR|nr:alcohol dehydrogenase catalytic domain-containing protein [Vibrio tetraodonis]MYM58068.1 alcohol dehydrogenase catalytic domain-containing protein [Vibrio tetraodonis subsp. pristinus]